MKNIESNINIENNESLKLNTSNPINNNKIKPLVNNTINNRLYSEYSSRQIKQEINYLDFIKTINLILSENNSIEQLYNDIHHAICEKTNLNFSALGIFNQNSNYIDLKLINKAGITYNSKFLCQDIDNPVIKSFVKKEIIVTDNCNYLKLNYIKALSNSHTYILPLCVKGDCLGVMMFSDNSDEHIELYKLIASYIAIFYKNIHLSELVSQNTDNDILTGLSNHKKLQENLSYQIKDCLKKDTNLAFSIIDISNMTEINNELGHAKGDLIIKEVANKIKKNVRNTDIIGRYSGDKIGIIMPDTSYEEAKYLCEYLLYNLSCTMFDDLGQLKFSCGISVFPTAADRQDKLTIMTERATYMAKAKSNTSGQSEIVTSNDFNLWGDDALKCFVQVITKKHAGIGINIEEELINQFHSEKIISNEHMLDVVSSLANAIDAKDTYTKGHSSAVSRYSEALARAINLPSDEVERIKLGALLHDIGKIGIPENILKKPTKLNDEEWNIMKQHPVIGSEKVLRPNKSLHDLIPIVKYHHEHIDGSGYPCKLKGDEIPLSAKIVAIADSYHALISDRPYRKGLSINKACEILKQGAGIQWDKELIRQFIIIAPSLATNI